MSGGPYDIGDEVELEALFTGPNPDFDPAVAESASNPRYIPTDPDTSTCTIRPPSGDADTFPVDTSPGGITGRVLAAVPIDQSGLWRYRFDGTGAATAAQEMAFLVRARTVPEPSP